MVLDFDLTSFIEDMKACKPPYKCPFKDCNKVYRSFGGIHSHIQSHANQDSGSTGQTPHDADGKDRGDGEDAPLFFFKSPVKETLVYNEATKKVEFEAEGRIHR